MPTGVPIELALLVVGSRGVGSVPELILGVVLLRAADLAGTTLLHVAARTGGVRLLARLAHRHEARTERAMARVRRRLGGHDALVVFVLRLVPVVRVGVTVGTGLLRIRPRDCFLGAVPAAVVWAGAPLALGYLFPDDVAAVEAWVATASRGLLVVVAAATAVGLAALWWRRARASRHGAGTPPDPPAPDGSTLRRPSRQPR